MFLSRTKVNNGGLGDSTKDSKRSCVFTLALCIAFNGQSTYDTSKGREPEGGYFIVVIVKVSS